MHHLRRNRPNPFSAWLACLAIVLNALVPAFAHAVAGLSGQDDVVAAAVCSFDGAGAAVPTTTDPFDRQSPHAPSLPSAAHCPYCLTGASIGPPCSGPTASLPAPASETPQRLSQVQVPPHFARSPAHAPRAPPAG